MTEQNQVSRESLKIQALTQRISELVTQYEDKMADFRVEHTAIIQQAQEQIHSLSSNVEELRNRIAELENPEGQDVPQEAGTEAE